MHSATRQRSWSLRPSRGYQIGMNGSWMDGKLTMQVSAFDYEHEGYVFTDVSVVPVTIYGQPLSFLNNMMPPGSPPLGDVLPVLYRVNKPTIDNTNGWDADINYSNEGLTLYVNASKVEIETDYTDGRESHTGWFSPPDFIANAGVAYDFGDTAVDVRVQHRGDTPSSLQERGNFLVLKSRAIRWCTWDSAMTSVA